MATVGGKQPTFRAQRTVRPPPPHGVHGPQKWFAVCQVAVLVWVILFFFVTPVYLVEIVLNLVTCRCIMLRCRGHICFFFLRLTLAS